MPLVSLFATHSGPPVVATFHAAPGSAARLGYRMMGPVLDRLLGRTTVVTAVSSTAASALPSSLPVEVIPNGLDVDGFRTDTPRHDSRLVFLGRDEPRKGLDILVEAWPAIRRDRPDAELVVIGARRDLDGIQWLGRVDEEEKVRALASAAVYVAPQTGGESFGIVLVEAMAAGTAVVASNLDAFVAVAEGAARFVPVGDSGALANAVVELLDDGSERGRLAAAGQRIAARHDWSVVGAAYREVYARVIS
jgi:phosphatidylinositol alpha-mannosyltransferase